jgi:hypothetical protein
VSRIVVASALVAAVSYVVWKPLDAGLGRSFPAQVVSLGAALVAAVAMYVVACRILRVREVAALDAVRARLRRG